jgi:adenine-specific DNA-methyltransferase
MRFIGNKENLVPFIYQTLISKKITGDSIFDIFSGTSNVGRFFKKKNYRVYSSDLLYFSHVLQQAYIQNNAELPFTTLLSILQIKNNDLFSNPLEKIIIALNQLPETEGFIYQHYTPSGTQDLNQPRLYFSDENGKRIDAIRQKIEEWYQQKLIDLAEYYCLLACLIETVPFYANISGVYAAFQKKWDKRALKTLQLCSIETIINTQTNAVYHNNSVELLDSIQADIFYLDPPYNQRQYAPNYHILETIAKYDNPKIKGVSGMRDYTQQKSLFCNAETGLNELSKIVTRGQFSTLVLSYNSEGIMPAEKIMSVLNQVGQVELVEFDYLRFKSHQNVNKKFVKEQLYILRK